MSKFKIAAVVVVAVLALAVFAVKTKLNKQTLETLRSYTFVPETQVSEPIPVSVPTPAVSEPAPEPSEAAQRHVLTRQNTDNHAALTRVRELEKRVFSLEDYTRALRETNNALSYRLWMLGVVSQENWTRQQAGEVDMLLLSGNAWVPESGDEVRYLVDAERVRQVIAQKSALITGQKTIVDE